MHWQCKLKEMDTLSEGRGSNGREKFWGKRVPGRGTANAQVLRWEQGWHANRLAWLRLTDNGESDQKWSQAGATSRCWISDWRRTRWPWTITSMGFILWKSNTQGKDEGDICYQQVTWKRSQDPQAVWELVWSDGFHTRAYPHLAPTWTKVTEVYPN